MYIVDIETTNALETILAYLLVTTDYQKVEHAPLDRLARLANHYNPSSTPGIALINYQDDDTLFDVALLCDSSFRACCKNIKYLTKTIEK